MIPLFPDDLKRNHIYPTAATNAPNLLFSWLKSQVALLIYCITSRLRWVSLNFPRDLPEIAFGLVIDDRLVAVPESSSSMDAIDDHPLVQ